MLLERVAFYESSLCIYIYDLSMYRMYLFTKLVINLTVHAFFTCRYKTTSKFPRKNAVNVLKRFKFHNTNCISKS